MGNSLQQELRCKDLFVLIVRQIYMITVGHSFVVDSVPTSLQVLKPQMCRSKAECQRAACPRGLRLTFDAVT